MKITAFRENSGLRILLCGFLAAALACSHSYPEAEGPPADEASRIEVIFRLPGDDFPYDYDLLWRDDVGRILEERGVGEVTGSGAGMGTMTLTLEVDEKEPAAEAVRSIISARYPGRVFRIE